MALSQAMFDADRATARASGTRGLRSLAPPAADVGQRLADTAMFAGLDALGLARLARATTARRLAAGEPLWVTGQRADHVALIGRGVIGIEQMTAHGEGVVVGLFGAGDSIGLPAVLERGCYHSDAIALTHDSDVLRIGAEPLLATLAHAPMLAMAVNRALVAHSAILRAKIEIVTAGSVPRRLAALFLHLAGRFGIDVGEGAVRLDLGLAREQIGRFVSTRVETVSRILSRWQKAGWLRSGRGSIDLLRADMLRRILGV